MLFTEDSTDKETMEPLKNPDEVYDRREEDQKKAAHRPRQYTANQNYGLNNNAILLDDHIKRIREVTDDPLAECIF